MVRLSTPRFIGVAVAVVMCAATVAIFSSCTGLGNGSSPAASTWYLHWTCGSSSQCAADFGGAYGVYQSFTTQSACQSQVNAWAASNVIQPYSSSIGIGSWCSTSSTATATP